ncbi:cupin [Candidatus Daviesbacteria bacterium]|nr:cupin [Candidatus Daviesbacteria bacterium]
MTIVPYVKRVEKPWGYEIHFTPDNLPYMGKILHISAGKRLSLQVHDQKLESWFLLSGKVTMILENSKGELVENNMEKGYGYTTQVGQKHRLVGVEDADILEVSTPEIGNTFRLEDDYSRPTETEEMRKQPNRGWK